MRRVPDAVPEIAHPDSGVHSINALAPEPNNVPSYADQQLQAERAEQTKQDTKRAINNATDEAKDFGKKAQNDAQRLSNDASKKAQQVGDDAGKKVDQAGKKAKEVSNKAGEKAQEVGKELEEDYEEVKEEGAKKYNQAKDEASKAADSAGKNYNEFKASASEDTEDIKESAEKNYSKFKQEASKEAQHAKQDGKKAEEWTEKNKGNPVFIGNVVVIGALGALLGTNAYRMHKANTLTWQVAGAWAGVVGLFAVGDYYVSSWLFKNKYPSK
ncbi:hypothetical protein LTR85_009183 [Meristemomyces frigidus]|nr:hypothetical protein LTR85_009183 [Meristemomyces frigidus]